MGQLTYSHTLVAGQPENVNDVQDMFDETATILNGNVDHFNIHSDTKAKLGLSDASNTRRGVNIVTTEETRNNTAYGLMTTPDRVSNIVLPSNGIIAVAFQGMFKSSVGSAGRAAIFIGANQLKAAVTSSAAPLEQECSTISSADVYKTFSSSTVGLNSASGGTAYTGPDVTTGQVITRDSSGLLGGPCFLFAAAGTYDITVQFKATSGTITAKERKLWVWTIGF